MGLEGKKLVSAFYSSDFYKNPEILEDYLHPKAELYWNSSEGFHKMNFQDIKEMVNGMSRTYYSLRIETSHLISEKDLVTIRFTYFVKTIENPEEELPLAHFIVIWKIKDQKLYLGHQISQQADDTPENLSSFVSNNF